MERVEAGLRSQAETFNEAIEGYVSYANGGSGKRLRPLVALLAGGATGRLHESHVTLAVILELIHIATLVHDDIMDGAELRRDRPTVNAKWGNSLSVLLGDCLFAHALRLSTSFDDQSVCRRIADASVEVCTGEIIQTQRRFDLNLDAADYFRIIEMKTAALFAVAGELGAQLSGASPEAVAVLKEFGRRFGTAYQIYDDCVDLVGSESQAGKTLGTDFHKGKLTLPVLVMLQQGAKIDRNRLNNMLLQQEDVDEVLLAAMLRDAGAVEKAQEAGVRLLDEAIDDLRILPSNIYTDAMEDIARYLSARFAELD